ncbi:MAG: hypothetical protein EOO65_02240, partial [Methanosarcinales archaeon]
MVLNNITTSLNNVLLPAHSNSANSVASRSRILLAADQDSRNAGVALPNGQRTSGARALSGHDQQFLRGHRAGPASAVSPTHAHRSLQTSPTAGTVRVSAQEIALTSLSTVALMAMTPATKSMPAFFTNGAIAAIAICGTVLMLLLVMAVMTSRRYAYLHAARTRFYLLHATIRAVHRAQERNTQERASAVDQIVGVLRAAFNSAEYLQLLTWETSRPNATLQLFGDQSSRKSVSGSESLVASKEGVANALSSASSDVQAARRVDLSKLVHLLTVQLCKVPAVSVRAKAARHGQVAAETRGALGSSPMASTGIVAASPIPADRQSRVQSARTPPDAHPRPQHTHSFFGQELAGATSTLAAAAAVDSSSSPLGVSRRAPAPGTAIRRTVSVARLTGRAAALPYVLQEGGAIMRTQSGSQSAFSTPTVVSPSPRVHVRSVASRSMASLPHTQSALDITRLDLAQFETMFAPLPLDMVAACVSVLGPKAVGQVVAITLRVARTAGRDVHVSAVSVFGLSRREIPSPLQPPPQQQLKKSNSSSSVRGLGANASPTVERKLSFKPDVGSAGGTDLDAASGAAIKMFQRVASFKVAAEDADGALCLLSRVLICARDVGSECFPPCATTAPSQCIDRNAAIQVVAFSTLAMLKHVSDRVASAYASQLTHYSAHVTNLGSGALLAKALSWTSSSLVSPLTCATGSARAGSNSANKGVANQSLAYRKAGNLILASFDSDAVPHTQSMRGLGNPPPLQQPQARPGTTPQPRVHRPLAARRVSGVQAGGQSMHNIVPAHSAIAAGMLRSNPSMYQTPIRG